MGVCLATSGPGATNLVTGIANAYLDSVPMVALTGQVQTWFIGKDAFQEIDITGITLPITKHNSLVLDVNDLAEAIKEAFYIARTGRPGPVLIDIPQDVLTNICEYHYPAHADLPGYRLPLQGHPAQIRKAAKMINEARNPVIVAGRGVIISGAFQELKQLAESSQIPVVNTLLGITAFPTNHVLSLGMGGMHGTAYANKAIDACDVLIAIGMRMDDRLTGQVSGFAPNAKIIHVDLDPAEIGKNVRVDVPIVGDIKKVLSALNKLISASQHVEWINDIEQWRTKYPLYRATDCEQLMPQHIMKHLNEATHGDALLVTGVGQHQMWAAQYYESNTVNSFISSGGLGTMGFGLPAAMGAKVGMPDKTVWCIDGDGSFQMTLHELATLVQDNIAVKIAIFNNGYLGMVRQWQELFFKRNYVGTPLTCPDFVKLAEAYCIPALRVTTQEEVPGAIKQAMDHDGPFLIDFMVEPEANVFPMVPPGAALAQFMDQPKKEVTAWPRQNTL